MKLQRKWARITTVFVVTAVLLLSAAGLMTELRPDIMRAEEAERYHRILSLLMLGSISSVAGMLVVMRKHLCCPHCKALSVNPWQKRGTIRYCSQCGAALSFDDGEIK